VNLTFVSADVNYMNITGYELSGFAVQAWMFYPQGGGPTPAWMNTTGCSNATSVKNEACDMVAPFQTVSAVLIPAKAVASPIQLGIFTSRANEFLFNFIAPVAIASVYFVQTGAGNTTPVFDGSTSYQPSEADNATIVSYDWRITLKSSGALAANGSGAELEVGSLPPATYTVKLTVYNSDGLNGTTSIPYYQS